MSTRSVALRWTGEGMVYRGSGKAPAELVLDGDSHEGASPMEALLLSLAACMAIDVQAILQKGRVSLEALDVEATGERAPEPPRRYTRISVDIRARGPGPQDEGKLERAAQLSCDRYCSVFHTLRPDLEVQVRTHRE